MAKVTLDMDTFKALASETRLQVLRALDERRKTLTEIAKELDLNKATVHEHMKTLIACELVRKRDDEGRKWIYYELTWQGQTLLHPETATTFSVLLGLSMAAASGSVLMMGQALGWWWDSLNLQQDATPAPEEQSDAPESDGDAQQSATADEDDTASSDGADGTNGTEAAESGDSGDMAGDEGSGMFLDDGGWIALALLGTALLFMSLALILRYRAKPDA